MTSMNPDSYQVEPCNVVAITSTSIEWYGVGQVRVVEVGGMRVTVRFVGRRGRPGRIAITARVGAVFQSEGRGCMHQGVSDNEYLEDKDGCYTTARKICSLSLADLIAWAKKQGFTTKNQQRFFGAVTL